MIGVYDPTCGVSFFVCPCHVVPLSNIQDVGSKRITKVEIENCAYYIPIKKDRDYSWDHESHSDFDWQFQSEQKWID